ncbi:uncharacterized protein BT62DRAFT_680042 [Guyanagaster necrorhizus]|uniref:F-box domain-containing protein n=1 Tax=Guyanagaster necrorhizus TaxID=856835 RepID=A0A9P7W0Y8_9AGAR|nr:uncharacterized protein BT62DRAFT_680042 [Guyanagaster necrorhizus MCA 3950]KAG7449366.1 hypothetical protein BT62DRAFT_680042 [Guyanagaster necrorhizus MCA 3950]
MPPKRRRMSNTEELKVDMEKRPQRTRGRRGKLQGLMDMPLYIWLEIFELLHPLDLPYLARSTKQLRSVLMNWSSCAIWKNARLLSSDFPEPMTGFSESAWVSLLFEPNCHFCVKGTVHAIDFAFRVRACGKCIQHQFISYQEALPYNVIFMPEGESISEILNCLPTRRSSLRAAQNVLSRAEIISSGGGEACQAW